jgi:hypothetical protein
MKRIFLFIIVFSSIIKPQQSESILSLKSQFQLTNNLVSSNQHPASSFSTILSADIQNPEPSSRKNPGLAILYSLLLPGMGELYAERYETGLYFTIADGVLWGALAGFNIYGNWQEKNYRAFAESNGGVTLAGKESNYFAIISSYISVDEYNTIQELNREFGKVYDPTKFYWDWKSNEIRKEYREMWSSSESAFNNVRFAAGALILNRLISAINAVRLVSAYNKNLEQQLSWNIYFSVQNKSTLPQSLQLNFISNL